MNKKFFGMLAAILFCGSLATQAQILKPADLEKYAKSKYGEKWVDAAANIAKDITLDKNQGLTYQQIIEAPGKTKQQLYVLANYWVTATFKDKQAITLNDKESGCIIINATMENIATHTGGLNQYSVSITPIIKIDIKEGKLRVTYTVQNFDILRDISGGVLGALLDKDAGTFDDQKRKKQNITNRDLYDEVFLVANHPVERGRGEGGRKGFVCHFNDF